MGKDIACKTQIIRQMETHKKLPTYKVSFRISNITRYIEGNSIIIRDQLIKNT